MHKKLEAELLPLDIEPERPLRNLRKVKKVELTTMAEQGEIRQPIPEETVVERPQRQMTVEEFWRPVIQDEYSVVRQPAIEANNFEFKPALTTMVQHHQYIGHPSEDPNEHMGRFLRMENTMKLNGVRPEVVKLQLFRFSLRDVATTWFESLPYGKVNNWAERCPMHGIDLTTQIDIFYHSMNYTSKGISNVACYGAFKRKSAEEVRKLIEDLVKCNYRALSETSGSSSSLKGSGGDRAEQNDCHRRKTRCID